MGGTKERAGYAMQVEIATKDNGILGPEVTNLPEHIQAAAVIVRRAELSQQFVVVTSVQPPLTSAVIESAISQLFPGSVVSVMLGGRAGDETIECRASEDSVLQGAAAAVATVKRSWSWDESPSIRVTVANIQRSFVVNPVFENGTWNVSEFVPPN